MTASRKLDRLHVKGGTSKKLRVVPVPVPAHALARSKVEGGREGREGCGSPTSGNLICNQCYRTAAFTVTEVLLYLLFFNIIIKV